PRAEIQRPVELPGGEQVARAVERETGEVLAPRARVASRPSRRAVRVELRQEERLLPVARQGPEPEIEIAAEVAAHEHAALAVRHHGLSALVLSAAPEAPLPDRLALGIHLGHEDGDGQAPVPVAALRAAGDERVALGVDAEVAAVASEALSVAA